MEEKKLLKRSDLLSSVDITRVWDKSLTSDEVLKVLEKLTYTLLTHNYEEDNRFIMNGRRKGLYDMINERLSKSSSLDDILESMFNLFEFISDEYNGNVFETAEKLGISPREVENICDAYRENGIICLREQHVILSMITKIRDTIQNNKKTGWNDIDKVLETLYPNQEPIHYGTIIGYSVGGNDPLDGISIYDAGDYYHFVTYGFSEIYEKETQNKDISGFGFELTFKLKKYPDIDEKELKNICGILQQLARYVFNTHNVFKPNEYIYTGQKEGMDLNHKSSIVAFVTVEDSKLKTIDTVNGKLQFIELIGVTYNEISQILNKEKTKEEVINDVITKYGDITDYNR